MKWLNEKSASEIGGAEAETSSEQALPEDEPVCPEDVTERMHAVSPCAVEASAAQAAASASKEGFLSTLKEWIVPIGLALMLALFIRIFIGGATTVQGRSMEPTLHNGDIIIVNRIPAYFRHIQRADIVVLDSPTESGKSYIKRVIGLPGETVEIRDNMILIDGLWLREYYLNESETSAYSKTKWTLGEEEYFVLGDNREPGASNDSRLFGPIRMNRIEGVASFRLWPFSRIGSL